MTEFAQQGTTRDFPSAWGLPQGSPYSEERVAWIRRNIEERGGGRAMSGLTALRALAARDQRLTVRLRLTELERRRHA